MLKCAVLDHYQNVCLKMAKLDGLDRPDGAYYFSKTLYRIG